MIEDVTKITSHKDVLVLYTKSGVSICFKRDEGPNYINVQSYLSDNETDLVTTVTIDWEEV